MRRGACCGRWSTHLPVMNHTATHVLLRVRSGVFVAAQPMACHSRVSPRDTVSKPRDLSADVDARPARNALLRDDAMLTSKLRLSTQY